VNALTQAHSDGQDNAEDMRRFGAHSTTTEVLAGIDLRGKVAVVTGASGGLGQETARAFAAHGARVVLTARNREKGNAVARATRASTRNEQVEVEELELGSLASVRACAQRLLARHPALHILVNNAGVMACPFAKTEDGFELHFGSNHLGHFLLAGLLLPALRRGAPSRVVSVSSIGHRVSRIVFEDLNFEKRTYNPWLAYGQSKTANVLFAVEFDRRFGPLGVHAYAVHPGSIPTELDRHLIAEDLAAIERHTPGGVTEAKSVAAGAATAVYAATAPELEGQGGVYLEDCHVAEVSDAKAAHEGVKSYAVAPALAQRLWRTSEELVGEHFAGE
jgi:NAD(P)-dependent dehydrogenase (short-subunit alcohol dehydrogenase family)